MTQSGAMIFRFDDVRDFYEIVTFIENLSNVRLIYQKMSSNDRLYITSESAMRGERKGV